MRVGDVRASAIGANAMFLDVRQNASESVSVSSCVIKSETAIIDDHIIRTMKACPIIGQ